MEVVATAASELPAAAEDSEGTSPPRLLPREERIVAGVRVFLATAFLAAASLDASVPFSPRPVARALLGAYLVFALAVGAGVFAFPRIVARSAVSMHLADLALTAALMFLTVGPDSVFFGFFSFVLLAAAYRWTTRATLLTAGFCVLLLVTHAVVIRAGLHAGHGELFPLLVRSTHLIALAIMVGYVSDAQKDGRADARLVNRLGQLARGDDGLFSSGGRICGELLRLFGAPRLLLVVEDIPRQRAFLWECRQGQEPRFGLRAIELEPQERSTYLFGAPSSEWLWRDGNGASRDRVWMLETNGEDVSRGVLAEAPAVARHCSAKKLLVGSAVMGELHGRLIVFDPRAQMSPARSLRLLRSVVRHVGAELHNMYLLRRLEQTAGERERARVARELHDSTLQALVGIGMKVEQLRGLARNEDAELAQGLARVQALLRNEVSDLRELMEQLRPLRLRPDQLLRYLGELIERFARDTGISSRFVTSGSSGYVPPRVCGEIARIVQEALVNVKKHSGAGTVTVTFVTEPDLWVVTVDDDGAGFPFTGRIEDVQLDRSLPSPAIIGERVKALGGSLAIESIPGSGARVEIRIPRRGRG